MASYYYSVPFVTMDVVLILQVVRPMAGIVTQMCIWYQVAKMNGGNPNSQDGRWRVLYYVYLDGCDGDTTAKRFMLKVVICVHDTNAA